MPAQAPHVASRMAAHFFSPNAPTPHPQRCEYTSKRCENARALKPNGERHRLCDHHRRLANNNQRRWQNRKKLQQRAEQSQISALLELRHATPASGSHSHTTARPVPRSRSLQGEAMPAYSTERRHVQQLPAPQHNEVMYARDPASHNNSHLNLPPLEPQPPPPLFRPQDQTLVLPRLRHHHVLSHALSLPVAHAHSAANAPEFGGVLRGHDGTHRVESFPPRRVAFERSASEPVEGAWSLSREKNDELAQRDERSWSARVRAVSSNEY